MDHKKAHDSGTLSAFGKQVASDNVTALLVYAIVATVFTVRLAGKAPHVSRRFRSNSSFLAARANEIPELRWDSRGFLSKFPVLSPVEWIHRLTNRRLSDPAGGPPDRDAHHEEAGGAHHLSVPRGGQSVHPPPPAGAAASLDLCVAHVVLGLLGHCAPLPGDFW